MHSRRKQRGIALLESLVAIAILAVAILASLLAQLKTVANAQAAMHRVQALRLVEDLDERIKTNPDGFGQLPAYRVDWNAALPAAASCEQQWCDALALAHWDVARWKESVARALPAGHATVFDPEGDSGSQASRRLGVMIGWRASERRADDTTRADEPRLPATDAGASGVTCPPDLVCHLSYVGP